MSYDNEQFIPSRHRPVRICPNCGGTEFDGDDVWLFNAKFYCGEECCRKAAANQ